MVVELLSSHLDPPRQSSPLRISSQVEHQFAFIRDSYFIFKQDKESQRRVKELYLLKNPGGSSTMMPMSRNKTPREGNQMQILADIRYAELILFGIAG
ncbi:unnamed protein product [Vicia faba]|uniref:Uncharacterized protein n=1 Tax=Vicia faba TaxID=3906 RepID=A0AAV0ZNJ0_VICFA|nr:unnamed protein product [Vicia faba]